MALEMGKKIKVSTLYFTIAGHASSEKPTKRLLMREVKKMYSRV